jgi:hypothetical protein
MFHYIHCVHEKLVGKNSSFGEGKLRSFVLLCV